MSDQPVDPAISARTRKALSEARSRGVKLGSAGADNIRATVEKRKADADAFADQHRAVFDEMLAQGLTHRRMAELLNERGIPAARGGGWTHGQVQRMLLRLRGNDD
ncbi:hypothetical protein SDC9_119988 [bioreactor metagenome]|uniref:Recombinase domain-containing protein n=1 Tax=bioreactor metagenome TaxID=1076179 RepID=A0A645C5S5_9ZZZZ